jgi:hypothetical protein
MRKFLWTLPLLVSTAALAQQATIVGPIGSGTVNAGTATDLAGYATSGTAVSDMAGKTVSGNYTFSGAQIMPVLTLNGNGAASNSPFLMNGTVFTGGNGTTTFPLAYLNQGSAPSSWSTNGTELGINAPSGFMGNFIDIHLNGGVSVFSVGATAGTITTAGSVNAAANLQAGSNNSVFWSGRSLMMAPADGQWKVTNNAQSVTELDYGATTASVFTINGGLKTTSAAVNMTNLGTSSAAVTGTMCWTSSTGLVNVDTTTTCLLSLEEFKDKHGEITGSEALSDVMALKPFWGSWKKTTPEYTGDKAIQPFLGAHQVASVDKRLAAYDPNGNLHSVRYQEMTAVLVSAMQKQQQEIDSLKNERSCRNIYIRGLVCW